MHHVMVSEVPLVTKLLTTNRTDIFIGYRTLEDFYLIKSQDSFR